MKPKYKRLQIIIISIASICLGALILLKSFNENIIFFYTPAELLSKDLSGKLVRVGGFVKEGSFEKNDLAIKFTITDNDKDLVVCYEGQIPNMFRENQGIVAKGKLLHNVFFAQEILVKHDEKYMPKELVNSIKDSGNWRN